MKKLILSLIVALGLVFGFSSVKASAQASEVTNINSANIETSITDNYIYVKVYENGAYWIYVYTEDGIFVTKYEDQ